MHGNEKEYISEYTPKENSINDFLVFRAEQLDLKQIDLVNMTGIKPSKMSKFFNRRLKPNMEDMEKLAGPLGVSREVLWIISGDMLPPSKESAIIDELKSLERLLSELSSDEMKSDIDVDIRLNANEKQFIQEYLDFVKYKRQKE